MAIELKQNLKLSQQLVITPQLQQAIKLLQMSRMELVEMVQEELMENPVLEESPQDEEAEVPRELEEELETPEGSPTPSTENAEVLNKDGEMTEPKEFDWENYIQNYNAPGEDVRATYNPDELPNYENYVTRPTSLHEHLEWQLRMSELSEQEEEIGLAIIEAIDENGYLTLSVEEIAEKEGVSVELVTDILKDIQEFDPHGVGSRNLTECLLLQCKPFGKERPLLEDLITNHLESLEKKDYGQLAKKLKLPLNTIIDAARIISEMEPKPGRPFGGEDTHYVTPDIYVHKVGSEHVIVLNDEGLPRLHVSRFYQNMMNEAGQADDAAKGYVQEKLRKALWLIKSIHQRQKTIYRVSKCILEYQKDFLDKGVQYLKPMILRDVAEQIGVHESTVSRATSSKYMHTPQGLFELKYFFNSKVGTDDSSDGLASEAVKNKIKQMIEAEDAKKPLSDQDIAESLKTDKINIARRTVAKYREMLGILPSSRRRKRY